MAEVEYVLCLEWRALQLIRPVNGHVAGDLRAHSHAMGAARRRVLNGRHMEPIMRQVPEQLGLLQPFPVL
jgi:hypothetical protein